MFLDEAPSGTRLVSPAMGPCRILRRTTNDNYDEVGRERYTWAVVIGLLSFDSLELQPPDCKVAVFYAVLRIFSIQS